VIEKVKKYVREHGLLRPGDRVAVAVSGGADSVALLRVLVELRSELGIVLSVGHFNHGIRGADSDIDEHFTRRLAESLELEFHGGLGHAPAHAREHKLSLETAARDLRHRWFAQLIAESKADKIATAHTLDDQAETVLMRVVRGAGTRGLAGIAPWQREKSLARPLLCITRKEVESYLSALNQAWREDATNRDLAHTRNRVRHELLPLLEQSYNPGIRQTLADIGEVARAEEEYWERESAALFSRLVREGKPTRGGGRAAGQSEALAVDLAALAGLPVAARRRLLRVMSERFGVALEFKHIEQLLDLAAGNESGTTIELPHQLMGTRSFRELQLVRTQVQREADYRYTLPVPGEVEVPELGAVVRAELVSNGLAPSYNSSFMLDRKRLAPELVVRNWRAGDTFFPAHTKSRKKVKELLQAARLGREISPGERKSWPVVESAGEIVWMRGFPASAAFLAQSDPAVLIQETKLHSGANEWPATA